MFAAEASGEFCGEGGVDGRRAVVLAKQRRADDDALRAGLEHVLRALDGVNAAARLARQALGDLLHERGVIALAHGGVEIDELHQRIAREFFDPVFEIVEGQAQLFALHQLHDAAAEQIDGRNQHGSLTGTPASGQLFFERAGAGDAEVKDAGGERGVGLAGGEDVGEMMQRCRRRPRR